MLCREEIISAEDVQKLFLLFNQYDISVPLKYAVMLNDINNIITEAEKAIRNIPDAVSTYDSEIYEESVKTYEPCPPSEFCDSSNSDRLLSLFHDVVGDDIRDTLDQMENGEYWENCNCSKDIKDVINECLKSISYKNSYGICNYYSVKFKLPPISDYADYDEYDDVEFVADIKSFYDFIDLLRFMIEIYKTIDQIKDAPNPYEAEKRFQLILKNNISNKDLMFVNLTEYDIRTNIDEISSMEEYINSLLDRISELLWESLDSLNNIKNIAEKANKGYETIFKAIDFVCEEFSRWANSVEDFYEKLENWREFFDANEMDDFLEELFGVESQMESQTI